MGVSEIVALIDLEIAQLQHARAVLSPKADSHQKSPAAVANTAPIAGKKKRNLSAEGRKRIADAVKKRWAERRKQAASS